MRRAQLQLLILFVSVCLMSSCGGGASGGNNGGGGTGTQLATTHFSVTAPASATVGNTVSVIVTALDASGAVVATYNGTVHFSSSDAQALLPANSTLTNGTGTFPVTLNTIGSQTIAAVDTSAGSISGTSNSISVTSPPTTHFSVVAPSGATIGNTFSVVVSALDASDDVVMTYSGTVHFSSTDSQAVLPLNSTLMNGTSSFSVSLKTPGSQQITATDTVTPSITGNSNSIVVVAAKAENPAPFINQPLSPDVAAPNGDAFDLTVNGTGFVPASVVNWNGNARATTFVSKSQLKAAIQAVDLASPGTGAITVTNPAPGGGVSNVAFFSVTFSAASVALGLSDFVAGSLPSSVAVGDFNGDGKLDLAVANLGAGNQSGNVSVLLGKGDGTFQAPVNYDADLSPLALAVGDFNGDGKLDLVIVNSDSNDVSVLLGNGDGTFQAPVNYQTGAGPNSVAVADFNGDGNLDLAVVNLADSSVSVLLGNGDGTFQAALNTSLGSLPQGIAVGDFNGDGNLDLAVTVPGASSGNISVLLGKGDGTFQAAINSVAGADPTGIASSDLNGNGKLDLAVADASGNVWVLLGVGDGTFQPAVDYVVEGGAFSISSGDFNGDGKPDLVASNFDGSDVSILLGNGDGTFQSPVSFGTNTQQSPSAVAVGDFNGDGRLDLAVADYDGPGVSVLLQATTATLSPLSLNFNTQVVGSTSPAQTLTLANTGDLTLDIASISVMGTNAANFGETNTCPSSLTSGANCTISVTFSPTAEGPLNASVSVSDNSAGSPQTAALTGLGIASGANVSLSPSGLTFPGQLLNTTSAAMTVTLTNYGAVPVNITSIAASANFGVAQACPANLAALASCTLNVTFTPGAAGNLAGTLTVVDDAPGSPQAITLSGIGAMPTTATLVPDSMAFACSPIHGAIGGCSPPGYATLTNTGNATLYFYGVTLSGTATYFSTANNCPAQLEPGQSCDIQVRFDAPVPRAKVTYTATLIVSDTASDSQQIALTGTASPE